MGRRTRHFSIGEVAGIIGVDVATIRSWERRYGWPKPDRSRGSHRRYRPADEPAFRSVAALRRSMRTSDAIAQVKRTKHP
jgi:DNA-binding transcriptional MerR regulator